MKLNIIDLKQISHCFEEYVPGQERRIYVKHNICVDRVPRGHLNKRFREQCVNRFMLSLMTFGLQVEKVSFPIAGSLHLDEVGRSYVGPLVTCQSTGDATRPFIGPFSNAQEMYLAVLDRTISTIAEGRGAWSPDKAVLAYLAYRMTRKLVSECEEMKKGPFYVCHGEPKGDHLLLDQEYRLQAVIDWEWEVFREPARRKLIKQVLHQYQGRGSTTANVSAEPVVPTQGRQRTFPVGARAGGDLSVSRERRHIGHSPLALSKVSATVGPHLS